MITTPLIANDTVELCITTTRHYEPRTWDSPGCVTHEDTRVHTINNKAVPEQLGRMLGEFLDDADIEMDWEPEQAV